MFRTLSLRNDAFFGVEGDGEVVLEELEGGLSAGYEGDVEFLCYLEGVLFRLGILCSVLQKLTIQQLAIFQGQRWANRTLYKQL